MEKIMDYGRNGDPYKALLYINRCLELNARWNYTLCSNDGLLKIQKAAQQAIDRDNNSRTNNANSSNNNQSSSNSYNQSSNSTYTTNITESNEEWKKAFMAHVEAAYSTYNIKNYSEAKDQIKRAWDLYKQYNLSLTAEERTYANTITDKLSNIEDKTDVVVTRNDIFNCYVSLAKEQIDKKKYAEARSSLNTAFNAYKNNNLSLSQAEINEYNRLNQKLEQIEKGQSVNNSASTIVEESNHNTAQDSDEQNPFEMLPKQHQQFILEIRQADSLRTKANSIKNNNTEVTRLQNECDEIAHKAELTKLEYLKSFSNVEHFCNNQIKKGENVATTYYYLGWLYSNKAHLISNERYHNAENHESYFVLGDEERALLSKSLNYYEKAYELDNTNNDLYNNMIGVRQLLGLDEYNPTFTISPTDVVKKYPDFQELEDDKIVIKKVIISDNQTIVEISNINKDKNGSYYSWMTISPDTYITINGQNYKLTKAEGIGISPEKTYFYHADQTKVFALYFPAIPKDTETMDLIEPGDSDWKFYGIKLK